MTNPEPRPTAPEIDPEVQKLITVARIYWTDDEFDAAKVDELAQSLSQRLAAQGSAGSVTADREKIASWFYDNLNGMCFDDGNSREQYLHAADELIAAMGFDPGEA